MKGLLLAQSQHLVPLFSDRERGQLGRGEENQAEKYLAYAIWSESLCPSDRHLHNQAAPGILPSPPTPSPLGVRISTWHIQGTQAFCPHSTGQILQPRFPSPPPRCPLSPSYSLDRWQFHLLHVWSVHSGACRSRQYLGTQRTCTPFALSRSRPCVFKASSEVTKDIRWLLVNFQCVSPGSLPTARYIGWP